MPPWPAKIVDLSADFRLHDAAAVPELVRRSPRRSRMARKVRLWLAGAAPRRDRRRRNYVSGVGCNATASNLALLPLVKPDLLDTADPVIIEIKVGSSEGGAEGNPGSHHPERAGVIRTFSPFGHRHTAEVIQELGLATCLADDDLGRPGARGAGNGACDRQTGRDGERPVEGLPRQRPVKTRSCAWSRNSAASTGCLSQKSWPARTTPTWVLTWTRASGHVVSMCAIDNLMKGASGSAVQCMNLMLGLDETAGLDFPGCTRFRNET